jgi:hypothetical protein
MPMKPLSRRMLLRGAGGAGMALPFLEAMLPLRVARAQTPAAAKRFIAFFYPNGTDPRKWNPAAGALAADKLPECLQDLKGFAAEGPWPMEAGIVSDVAVVTGIDHSGVSTDIHVPSMALSAHKGTANNYTPPEPTLDQYLADRIKGETPFRNLALAATPSTDIAQGNISFRTGGQVESVTRDPKKLFDKLMFSSMGSTGGGPSAAEARRSSVLVCVRTDAQRLQARLGAGDRRRLDQYFQSVSELEKQVKVTPPMSCTVPPTPTTGGNWHTKTKQLIDLAVLAMACDLTRVVTIQYSDSWGVNYTDYQLGTGMDSVGTWSDHFLSHKLDDTDRATDLDGLPRADAMRIADVRVVATSRFKVRRFTYLVNKLKQYTTPSGTLLDESLAMYISENGDGDSHSRKNMPVLLAGHVGGFQTGRAIAATDKPTGALHASILRLYGVDVASYGSPAGAPLTGF